MPTSQCAGVGMPNVLRGPYRGVDRQGTTCSTSVGLTPLSFLLSVLPILEDPAELQCSDSGGLHLAAFCNDYLISQRKPALGFLNPLAGSGQFGFNNVTYSSNPKLQYCRVLRLLGVASCHRPRMSGTHPDTSPDMSHYASTGENNA